MKFYVEESMGGYYYITLCRSLDTLCYCYILPSGELIHESEYKRAGDYNWKTKKAAIDFIDALVGSENYEIRC